MACRGVHFAITEETSQHLKRAVGDDEQVLRIVQDEIEEAWDEEHLCQSDKAWDAIHRCLTNGTLNIDQDSHPLSLCILGGEQLHKGDSYIVSMVSPGEVKQVAAALQPLKKDWFRTRYFAIDPKDYGPNFDEQDFEYTWDYFEGVRDFYQKAAVEGRWVIFSVDQ
jgi:hypothetical protein